MGDKMKKKPFQERYKTGEKSLTKIEVDRLLAEITDLKDLTLFKMALSCGLRREDIVRVKVADINFCEAEMSFYERKKKSIHTVPLNQNLIQTLKMLLKIKDRKNPYLFEGFSEKKNNKGHLSGRTAYNLFQGYLKKIGLESRPFHALRSSCIKLCQYHSWKPEATAKLVNDTLEVIQKHYSVPSRAEMQEISKNRSVL